LERPGRPNPYGVQWRERLFDEKLARLVSRPKTLFFPTKEARDEKAAEMRGLRKAGMLTESVSRADLADFRAFQAATQGVPWQEVVAVWRAGLVSAGLAPTTVTVSEATKSYLDHFQDLVKRGDRRQRTYLKIEHKLERFAADFGARTLASFNGQAIEDWIDDLEDVSANATFNTYRKVLHAFFEDQRTRKVIRENPCSQVRGRDDTLEHVGILSVSQTAQVFLTALSYFNTTHGHKFRAMLPRLATEAFGGMRTSSAIRLEKSDINVADRGILLPKRKLKTKRRHYIDGLPENLWPWMELASEETWLTTENEYSHLKVDLFERANVPHPHNCFRHGFASYHVAAFKNPGTTAYILCHRDQQVLWEHYKGNAKEADGRAYFTITPKTVAQMAEGYEPAARQAAPLPAPN
jgi:site-specific recombinase XerD